MKKYPTWVITIEGHADERGTAEYNLALGERRAMSARTYLVSLGISADRLRTVSYGKEFPVRSGPRRGGLGQEPAGAVRAYQQVSERSMRGERDYETDERRGGVIGGGAAAGSAAARPPPARNSSC